MRWTDPDGHDWPITGFTCVVCSLPLHPGLRDVGTHPTCDPDFSRTRAAAS